MTSDSSEAQPSTRFPGPVSAPPLFASIGHQDDWGKMARVLNALRREPLRRLSMEEVREIVPWIPPRAIVRLRFRSWPEAREIRGVYIDTFLPPESLAAGSFRSYVHRIRDAARCAEREGVRIGVLGGFTSVVLEGNVDLLDPTGPVAFTTGNSLTTAYIVRGLERACRLHGVALQDAALLVVGSTGDIGSACIRYLKDQVRALLLCARNGRRLEKQRGELESAGYRVAASTDPGLLVPRADAIIMAASAGPAGVDLDGLPDHVVVCDAGYPRNIVPRSDRTLERLFHGGMGIARGGFDFEPDLRKAFYDFPVPGIGHGCMFEGAALALEERFEAFSTGRGRITPEDVDTIWDIASRHGMDLAPFYNHAGLWTDTERPLEPTPIS